MAAISEQLKELTLKEVVETGRLLGAGAYGEVVEVRLSGLKCAGKKLHGVFFHQSPPSEQQAIVSRFVEECLRLSKLRHPNVVQLLGVHFLGGVRLPMMVMELLPTSLTQCLERHRQIPEAFKTSILYDVSLGLQYLHTQSPPIIHRDLTANNILLTSSMNAKLADLGVARIVNLSPAQMTARLSVCPGTPSFMPPEALSDKPQYDQKLDVFSFGNLILHVSTQQWPLPSALLASDPRNPEVLKPLTEIQRRQKYLDLVDEKNPLKSMAVRCLQNLPRQRLSTNNIASELEQIYQSHASSLPEYLEAVTKNKELDAEYVQLCLEVQKKNEIDAENAQLRHQVQTLQSEVQKKNDIEAENGQLRHQIQTLQSEVQKKNEIDAENAQLRCKIVVLQQEAERKDRIHAELKKEKSVSLLPPKQQQQQQEPQWQQVQHQPQQQQQPHFHVDDQRNQPIPVSEFAAHVNSLHARRDLGFEEEYSAFKNNPQGPYTVSKLPHNAVKNRFENVFPFDCARVELSPVNGEVGSDYINASWMDGYRKEKAYIAAQGPLEKTIADFWRMVWEFQLPTIVMLTELVERAIEKCSCYWPRSINQTLEVGSGLRVTLIEQRAYVEYKLKKIILFNTAEKEGGKLEVTHYHFTAWPDHGVPADKTCMLAFIKRIRKAHPPMGPPLVVHCSAGVGRTGTFITLDTMLQRMEDGQDLNVYQFIKQMRTKRVLMVQTEAQYTYIHDALAEYITCGDTSIEATSASVFKRMEDLEKVTDHKTGYQCQFELLGDISIKASDGLCSEALHTQNVNKNRYRESLNALPFNYNRVRLKTMTGPGDYINASIVDGYKHRGAFLATQAPLENTVDDFWRMVWESQSMAIVMLYDVNEGSGSDERKLCQYWPTNPGEEKPYGKMLVKLVSEKEQTHYTLRKLELRMESTYINLASGGDKGDKFIVTQYQYRKWPESGKPPEPLQILRLIENLIKTQSNTGNKAITVICSDGIGRTGAFVCIYSVLERVKTEAVADIFQFIKSSRFQRAGLVKELDQYIFCHEMLQEFLSTFDNYANFEVKR